MAQKWWGNDLKKECAMSRLSGTGGRLAVQWWQQKPNASMPLPRTAISPHASTAKTFAEKYKRNPPGSSHMAISLSCLTRKPSSRRLGVAWPKGGQEVKILSIKGLSVRDDANNGKLRQIPTNSPRLFLSVVKRSEFLCMKCWFIFQFRRSRVFCLYWIHYLTALTPFKLIYQSKGLIAL